jgi:hypothetical protein
MQLRIVPSNICRLVCSSLRIYISHPFTLEDRKFFTCATTVQSISVNLEQAPKRTGTSRSTLWGYGGLSKTGLMQLLECGTDCGGGELEYNVDTV